MISNEFKMSASDGKEIHVYEWLPADSGKIKGVIQIVHGMAEHAGRYEDFAGFLTSNGFAVYANDHRGHGQTAGEIKNVGFFAPKNGWGLVISDIRQLSQLIKEKHKGLPFYMFGQSMGSFLARNFIIEPDPGVDGVILSGTAGNPGIAGKLGVFLTHIMMLFYPANSPTPVLDNMSFGAYNKPFKPNRTKFDWLSRDNMEVDKYVDDPYCGGICSIKYFNDMANGLLFINKQKNIDFTPKDLPVLFISGENDPVGNHGKGVSEVFKKFKKSRVKNLSLKLFPDSRHEILNEINKKEVYLFVLDWLNKTNA